MGRAALISLNKADTRGASMRFPNSSESVWEKKKGREDGLCASVNKRCGLTFSAHKVTALRYGNGPSEGIKD